MIGHPQQHQNQLSEAEAQELIRSLLHKEGTWVDWGIGCQALQQSGYSTQDIFEQTGFQASQQNLIIVAAQVYNSIAQAEDVSAELLAYCRGPRSDVLYELRVLNHQQRAIAAQLVKDKKIEADVVKEVARAMQHFARISQIPDGFTEHPGDAVAYQAWRAAKQKKDLQERSRLIAKGLQFVHSDTAREKITQLLSNFSVTPTKTAPLLPLYRYQDEDKVPYIVPVAGTLPLSVADIQQVEPLTLTEPFNLVTAQQGVSVLSLPGWQSVLLTKDPVVIFHRTDLLPQPIPGKPEPVLLLVDRAKTEWDEGSYFLVEREGTLDIAWFPEQPTANILGQIVFVMRPKKIFDENNLHEPWQMDD